jgi:hypothetical protein
MKKLPRQRHTPHPALSRKGRGKDNDEECTFVMMLSCVCRGLTAKLPCRYLLPFIYYFLPDPRSLSCAKSQDKGRGKDHDEEYYFAMLSCVCRVVTFYLLSVIFYLS